MTQTLEKLKIQAKSEKTQANIKEKLKYPQLRKCLKKPQYTLLRFQGHPLVHHNLFYCKYFIEAIDVDD